MSQNAPPGCAGSRFVAVESNATYRPSAEIDGPPWKPPFPSTPAAPVARLTSVVTPAPRFRTNTSGCESLARPAARLPAFDQNATTFPSAEIDGSPETASPCAPPAAVDARLT